MENLSECPKKYPDLVKNCAVKGVQQDHWTVNNNNNMLEKTQKKLVKWDSCEGIANNLKRTSTSEDLSCTGGTVEDEGGGIVDRAEGLQENQLNGLPAMHSPIASSESRLVVSAAVAIADSNDLSACAVGAASLTPPAVGSAQSHSNRTSINNSTENLSYSSDNYYADDLILLGDVDDDDLDVEAEEISLNSDDCVYAYRGDGADFDFALHQIAGRRGGDIDLADDETDFLEMDFEPDPLSEAEFGPIDDLPPQKALQTQALLSKNFALISLHLDQIKGCEESDQTNNSGGNGGLEFQRVPTLSGLSDVAADVAAATTAHSLPNTLHHGDFGLDTLSKTEAKASPTKVTGAKPKRLSTSSSTSSKNSNKSRTSLRSVYSTVAPLCNSSTSFDERSASCSEFRSAAGTIPQQQQIKVEGCINSSAPRAITDLGVTNDETACLDCLEKEFLANTIGKALDINNCHKCRRHGRSLSLYARAAEQSRSSSFFNELDIFDAGHDFSNTREDWTTTLRNKIPVAANSDGGACTAMTSAALATCLTDSDVVSTRSAAECENFVTGEQLLKNLLSTDEQSVTISMANLNAEKLEQALEKLHVFYNAELLHTHFDQIHNKAAKRFRSLKHFLLHESKKWCNQPKLKRLIKLATREQVEVEFEKDASITEMELVSVNVADILPYCIPIKNLELLQQLNDKRFIEANVLGKVVNIVRLAQQQRRRALPDFIMIPQYYPTGFLTLIKNC